MIRSMALLPRRCHVATIATSVPNLQIQLRQLRICCDNTLLIKNSNLKQPNVTITSLPMQQSTRRSSSAAVRTNVVDELRNLPIPSNLKFDPRSSFAPTMNALEDEEEEAEYDGPEDETDLRDDGAIEANDKVNNHRPVLPEPEVQYVIPLPDRLKVDIHTLFTNSTQPKNTSSSSSLVGSFWLNAAVFGRDPVRIDLLQRAVEYYRAKQRGRRTAVTKTISQVSGSGRKLRPQKGSGKARVGHGRPAHHRGGAKAHGPKNNTHYGAIKLNKKVRKLCLANALSQKLKEGNIVFLDQTKDLPSHKTKELVELLKPFGIAGDRGSTALVLDHYFTDPAETKSAGTQKKMAADPTQQSFEGVPINLWVAASNLHKIKVGSSFAANVYDILKYDKLVLTLEAVKQIEDRLSKTIG